MCLSGNHSYETPLRTNLVIISDESGYIFNATDRVMLLADMSNPNTPSFYCTKYVSSSFGIQLYLDITFPKEASCDYLQPLTNLYPIKILQINLSDRKVVKTLIPKTTTTTTNSNNNTTCNCVCNCI